MSDEGATPEDEQEEWDSGPYCRHWGDPSDCDEKCVTCGHGCPSHRDSCSECDCQDFKDPA